MDYSLLLSGIAKYVELTNEEQDLLAAVLHYRKVKKRQLLLSEGDVMTRTIFVTSGCLRSYAIDKNGTEHVLQFAPAGWWIADIKSYLKNEPARLNIDAIEDAEIIYIEKPDFDALHLKLPKLERYERLLGLNALAAYQHRQIDNATLPAIERYKSFCKLYPSLILTLPQKQIASYIGVTPEFLSKMLNTTPIK